MTTIKHFWDLEDTCITSWSDPLLKNISKLREWVADNQVTEVTIFSFAIWSDADTAVFNRDIKAMLETAFGIKVVEVLTSDHIRKVVCGHMSAQFDLHDFLSLWGKKRAFAEYCSATLADCTAVLIDDCVPNMTVTDHDKMLVIEYIDVTRQMRNVCTPVEMVQERKVLLTQTALIATQANAEALAAAVKNTGLSPDQIIAWE